MDLVAAVDIESTDKPILVSFCGDSSTENITSDSRQHHVCSSPTQGQLFERTSRHSFSTPLKPDESCWLQTDEDPPNFDFLDGISDISVDSDDFPVPEFTIQAVAKKWRDKIEQDEKWQVHDDKNEGSNNDKSDNKCEVAAKSSSELNESEQSASTECSDNSIQPQAANSTFTKTESGVKHSNVITSSPDVNTNSTFNKDTDLVTDAAPLDKTYDTPKTNIPQLQIPSTMNTSSEVLACGEVAVIRECCNPTIELEASSSMPMQSTTHESATDKGSKVALHPAAIAATVMKKKGPVVPSSVKPMFSTRKLPVKNNSAAVVKTPTKTNSTLQNSNQSHLPNQEIKLNIKKSLLSKPIVVSKVTAKTESTVSVGPCKPAGLKIKRPVNKISTKSHSVKLSKIPDHSTPVKDQAVYRRRSVAVSPQRDSSEATDEKSVPTKQKRRSGIPLLGNTTRDYPMSPFNKSTDHQPNGGSLGMSPIAVGKKLTKAKSTRQIGIPKPKTQLNFNTNFDPLQGVDLDGPPPGGSKLVYSPAEKENNCDTAHSQWSPIRRNKGIPADEECIRCTKHTAKYF